MYFVPENMGAVLKGRGRGCVGDNCTQTGLLHFVFSKYGFVEMPKRVQFRITRELTLGPSYGGAHDYSARMPAARSMHWFVHIHNWYWYYFCRSLLLIRLEIRRTVICF